MASCLGLSQDLAEARGGKGGSLTRTAKISSGLSEASEYLGEIWITGPEAAQSVKVDKGTRSIHAYRPQLVVDSEVAEAMITFT